MGRAAVSAAVELMRARLGEPPHRGVTMLRRIDWLLAGIGVALALGGTVHLAWGAEPPCGLDSYRLLYGAEKKYAFGSCGKRTLEHLRNECLRDGGRAGHFVGPVRFHEKRG
jgi:hypothetical protein